MKANPTPSNLHPKARLVPYAVLAVGVLATALVAYYVHSLQEFDDQARFRGSVQEINSNIEGRIATYVAILRAGTGLFATDDNVDARDFKNFVSVLNLPQQYPGIQGIGYSRRFTPAEIKTIPSLKIWPETERDQYHAIVFLEPLDQRNQIAIGYDMFTDPARREAMERARDTGLPAASGRVTLVQEIDSNERQSGFLIYVPVYQKGLPLTTATERAAALSGFVYAPFRAGDFLQQATAKGTAEDVSFKVYDGDADTPAVESLLLDASPTAEIPAGYQPRFTADTNPNVPGRRWTVRFETLPNFDTRSGRNFVPLAVTGGLLISVLFFGLTRLQTKARYTAELSANKLQASEATIRKTLEERERAEAAIEETEARYRDLVENANDIVYTLDLKGNVTSINKAAEVITGYAREELLNRNLAALMTEESIEANRRMLERKLAGEERTNYEMDLQVRDGRILTFEINSRLIFSNGQPIGVQGIARDITIRRRAEEALRQADQRALAQYEKLVERVSALAQTLGTSRDLPAVFRGLREFTIQSVPCDGFFVSLYDPVKDVRTACYGWADGEEIDISELPPMPVTTDGPNSRAVRTNEVIITNDYMRETRGHPAILVGPDNGLRPESSLSAPMSVMGRVIGTVEVQTYQKAAFREGHLTAMRMAANLTAVAIENVRLLERESTARANAEESNRLKDEFLATVSHELRTPLTAILGWSRMLEGGSLEDETSQRAIETIKRNAKAQAQIIDDILDVSRIITGNLYLELNPLDLGSVIDAAINVVRPTAEAKSIKIEVDFDRERAVVSGDSNRLQQVFWNLLSNAVKFTPANGKVKISLHRNVEQIEVTVTDTGQGISGQFLPYVFDRFRQADSTSTRQHGGLGLGLAIARHLIEIHGGTIEARSEGDGKGSQFTVKLPVVGTLGQSPKLPEPEEESLPLPKSHEALSGVHVLIVDDDEDTLELLSAALRQRSADVTAVSSAAQALDSIKISRPDVLISDIAMPGSDGYELIEKVIALNKGPKIPAIAITAYAREEDREKALAAGYQRFLSKPVELREFISAVAEYAGVGSANR